ncbi:F420-0--gamma-glutamyl ligase [Anaerorhabdus furcosa]|uniref:F420-0:Gamma-glutamyl ligase n=1 Tax=Anaerorhabdus furcosa TaxID=118967 RepID=A0A1T4NUT1_9FIRM|nr:F420-0--gamma-glutamyl ligase [Anaerorhabdus furcosa]SJZ83039.1 hypothetical protein SAMN02745191_1741 [Anaerorhabdus furcosa]
MNRNKEDRKHVVKDITYYKRDDIEVQGDHYERLAIHTHFIARGESYVENIEKYVKPLYEEGNIVSISEKVISMCQNNCVDKADVRLGFWAKFLSKFAHRSSAGIGMDEPYKLQLAINIVGLPKILYASFCSVIGKLFGKRGVFYEIVGNGIAGIDGFYPNSSFDIYKDTAVLNPKNPNGVCEEIYNKTGVICVIVDANDISREILGKSSKLPVSDEQFLQIIRDNPAGQSDELTPFILIKKI